MAGPLISNITKQSLKFIEIPLIKFTEEMVPHHQNIFEQHKAMVQKLVAVNNAEQLQREIRDKKHTIKQLRDLMYELDTLRTQVEDEDLDKFDTKTLSLRKIIISLINGYTELEKAVEKVTNRNDDTDKENCNPFEGTSQIQIQDDLKSIKLKQQQEQLNQVENINKDVGELHEMYKHLNQMVDCQSENVDHIEKTVDDSQKNVDAGAKDIMKVHKLKAVAYPVTGAFLGGMIGGPIGLVAGLKIGGVAALGCAIAGYTGGKYFKKIHCSENIQQEVEEVQNIEVTTDTSQKKDM